VGNRSGNGRLPSQHCWEGGRVGINAERRNRVPIEKEDRMGSKETVGAWRLGASKREHQFPRAAEMSDGRRAVRQRRVG
jgi:hypothetical protein